MITIYTKFIIIYQMLNNSLALYMLIILFVGVFSDVISQIDPFKGVYSTRFE